MNILRLIISALALVSATAAIARTFDELHVSGPCELHLVESAAISPEWISVMSAALSSSMSMRMPQCAGVKVSSFITTDISGLSGPRGGQ